MRRLWSRLRAALRRVLKGGANDQELSEELRAFVEEDTESTISLLPGSGCWPTSGDAWPMAQATLSSGEEPRVVREGLGQNAKGVNEAVPRGGGPSHNGRIRQRSVIVPHV